MIYLLCVTRSCSNVCVVQTIVCIIFYHQQAEETDTGHSHQQWLFVISTNAVVITFDRMILARDRYCHDVRPSVRLGPACIVITR